MNRQDKSAVITSLKNNFKENSASFVVGVNGLTVVQIESLRDTLRQQGAKLNVAKVRLMKRALQDAGDVHQGLEPFLKEQIALVFVQQEAPAIAKILCGFAKENERFSVVAGYMDSMVLDTNAVKTIASLPSRQVLLAQLAATLNAPVTGLVCTLHQMVAQIAYVLKAIEEKKQ